MANNLLVTERYCLTSRGQITMNVNYQNNSGFTLTAKLMNLISLDNKIEPRMKLNLLKDHARGVFISFVGNMINIAGLAYILYSNINPFVMGAAISLLLVILYDRSKLTKTINQLEVNQINDIEFAWDRLCRNTIFYGIWWAISLFYIMHVALPLEQIIVIAAGAGMMSGAAIAYRTVEAAAKIAVTLITLGCLLALIDAGNHVAYATALLLGSYYLVLMRHIMSTGTNIVIRIKREQELLVSAETINLLLADFTEQGSDWLIEFNSEGILPKPCDRMAKACSRPIETLENSNIFTIIDDNVQSQELRDHMRSGRTIRKHIVSLTINAQQRWWSISARVTAHNGEDQRANGNLLYRGVVSDITAQRHAEEKVNYMAHFDALTDLPNRFQFNQHLNHYLNSEKLNLGLMYLDLDNFKAINDTLGHVIGDKLLQSAARRLEECARDKDIVARLGGDEFAIIVRKGHEAVMNIIAERIIGELSRPFLIDGHDVVIGCSIGIAIAMQDGDNPELLLRNADLALYSAKSNGRNRAVRYKAGMDESAQFRRMLEMDMRGALAKNEMMLHYQPIVNLNSGVTSGYEALIRWEHPERGIVMPDQFIPVAEETSLIVQIGEWVIRRALDDMTQWPSTMSVSINLSPAQMRSPSLISTIINALARTQIDASRICLEITETVLMQDSAANLATLHKLRSIGLKIALDDFGTGYSSLNYLRSFPFDKIKIDRCFVDEIDSREDCQAIVKSVVDLANSLGISTTAEGVERGEQLDYLRSRGCIEAQGYLYSKAVPQNELSNLRVRSDVIADKLVLIEEKRKRSSLKLAAKTAEKTTAKKMAAK